MGPVRRPVERCDACKFYDDVSSDNGGEGACRRYPPVPWLPQQDEVFSPEAWVQPSVYGYDGCGEWQAIESTT